LDFWLFSYPLLTSSLTPGSRVLLEKITGSQVVKKFPAFDGTRRFITAFTNALLLTYSILGQKCSPSPHPSNSR